MILISLLVHEKIEVILDQITNFRKYVPDSAIVVHPARQFAESSGIHERLRGLDHVWVNPKPFYTGFGTVLRCHVSNFLFAEGAGIPFSHFCLHASNDMFVRLGTEDYVKRHDFGFFQHDLSSDSDLFANWIRDFHKDRAYRRIMRAIGVPRTNLASQVEGTFFPREAYLDFARIYKRHAWRMFPWPVPYVHGTNLRLVRFLNQMSSTPKRRAIFGRYAYPTEEFYPTNFFSTLCPKPAAPYCFMNWDSDLKITIDDITNIRSGTSPLIGYGQLYCVKRVQRDLSDHLRIWINSLDD